jgi:hypothetical protein
MEPGRPRPANSNKSEERLALAAASLRRGALTLLSTEHGDTAPWLQDRDYTTVIRPGSTRLRSMAAIGLVPERE